MAAPALSNAIRQVVAAAFDPVFYRSANPDVAPVLASLAHYCRKGWREGRDPAPWFSVDRYLEAHPDVRAARVEPLHHYLTQGRWEGRDVAPSRGARAYLRQMDWTPRLSVEPPPVYKAPPISLAEQRAAVAPEFDSAFYRARNSDIAASGVDPLGHFVIAGWREGRDPNPRFSVSDYLDAHPDVAASGLNPFAHYVIAGRAEGRRKRHDLGFRYDLIARSRTPGERIREAATWAARAPVSAAETLTQGLKTARTGLRRLHITFSHDNYSANIGGVQLCLRRESARVAELGLDHLHLYPATPWPVTRAGEVGRLGVLLNGVSLGAHAPGFVRDALASAGQGEDRHFAIHSLLGHDPDETLAILHAAGMHKGWFWLHDFASLCAGVHLLRNDVQDCGAPAPDSGACGVCAYGPLRGRHLAAHRRLFETLDLTVVAPAEATLAFWRARTDLPVRDTVVMPHARLVPRAEAPRADADGPFRLAFLGLPTPLKGWMIFKDLAEAFADDPRYQFLHLGGEADPAAEIRFHRVVANEENPHAMQSALEAHAVDAALIWPLCRETFSFTAYETVAAGAAILTGPDSGNVAAFVTAAAAGEVISDEATLYEHLASGAALALSRARRRAEPSDLAYSGMTGDLIAAAAP